MHHRSLCNTRWRNIARDGTRHPSSIALLSPAEARFAEIRTCPSPYETVYGRGFGATLVAMLRPVLSAFLSLAFLVGSAVVLLYPPIAAHAQERSERLILKDGSFQSVAKYEIQGDRVHYLSSERYEWEDIPSSLIDWDATNKYNQEISSGKTRIHLAETPEEKEEREKEEANSPEIAPGLKLPGSGGIFLFDQFQGKPELAEIVQNGSEAEQE